jgi:rubrerythrin
MSWKVIAIYRCKTCGYEFESEGVPDRCPSCDEFGPYMFERVRFDTLWLPEI